MAIGKCAIDIHKHTLCDHSVIHGKSKWFVFTCQIRSVVSCNVFHIYSPRPPAPRNMPPTASASHSLETPIMMQPATMLSRAEPTRSPWYSPTLTGFIQQVETPHLALTAPGHCASLLHFTATGNFTFIWSWCLLFLHSPCRKNTFSGGAPHLYSPWLKMSHASLKKKLGFLLLLKIRKLEALTLISRACMLQIWSQCQRPVCQHCKCLQFNFLTLSFFCSAQWAEQLIKTLWLLVHRITSVWREDGEALE